MQWAKAATGIEHDFWDLLQREEEQALQAKSIAWVCSYTPVEIIAACNLVPWRLLALEKETPRADAYLHPTLCSYVRGALESLLAGGVKNLQGVVVLNSCNAACHLYYACAACLPQAFCYLLDLPRNTSAAAVRFWAGELREFHRSLAAFLQRDNQREDLQEQIVLYRQNRQRLAELYRGRKERVSIKGSELLRLVQASMLLPPQRFKEIYSLFEGYARQAEERGCAYGGPRLLLLGSIASLRLTEIIEAQGGVVVLDDLCLGRRAVSFAGPPYQGENPYDYLARLYLTRSPCARMPGAFAALDRLQELVEEYKIEGIVLHYLKFCDPWYYLGQILKEKIKNIPVLVLEGEYTAGSGSGQMRTRLEAFLEMLGRG